MLLLSATARAADVYVDAAWAGTQSGTAAEPYATFTAGHTALGTGDRLLIKPGTYSEAKINSTKALITIAPWPGESGLVVLDGTNGVQYPFAFSGGGVVVTNSPAASILVKRYTVNAVYSSGTNVSIYGLICTSNGNSGTGGNAIRLLGSNPTVSGCILTNNYRMAIYASSLTNGTISGCTISDTIHSDSGATAYGILVDSCVGLTISSNTVSMQDQGAGNQIWGIHVNDATTVAGCSNITVTANVMSGNATPFWRNSCVGIICMGVRYSTISQNTCTNWGHYGIDIGGNAGDQSQGITIERNYISDCGTGGIAVDGDNVGAISKIIVRNNVSLITVEPLSGTSFNGCFDFHGDVNTCTGNVGWYNNTAWVSPSVTNTYAAGLWTDNHTGVGTYELINNVFMVAAGDALKWQTNFSHGSVTLSNNMFYSATGKAIRFSFGGTLAEYANDHVLGGSAGYFSFDQSKTGLLNGVDPLFASAPTDLKPASGSSLRGAGVNLSADFTVDFAGLTRSDWDIGAYEYSGTPPIPPVAAGTARAVTARVGTLRTQ